MPPSFTITTPLPTIPTSASGRADVIFTVANTSGISSRAMAKITPSGETRAEWLQIAGESERAFPVNGNEQFIVIARVPEGVPEGSYPFRLDVVSAQKSSEERLEGPVVSLAVPARPAPPPKKSYWWIVVAVLVLLVVVAVAAVLLTRDKPAPEPPPTDTGATSDTTSTDTGTTPPIFTATIVDLRVEVPNVINAPVATAEFNLRQAGLRHRREMVTDDLIPIGTVKDQRPAPGARVFPDTEAVLHVVSGPDLVVVPDLRGATADKVQSTLERIGLSVRIVPRPGFPPKRGEVIEQNPRPGARVRPGETVTVILDGFP